MVSNIRSDGKSEVPFVNGEIGSSHKRPRPSEIPKLDEIQALMTTFQNDVAQLSNEEPLQKKIKATAGLISKEMQKWMEFIKSSGIQLISTSQFDSQKLLEELQTALKKQNNQSSISTLLEPLFENPNDLNAFLTFLKSKEDVYYLTLLKTAFVQKNPVIFREIVNYLASNKPELLSTLPFRDLLNKVFNEEQWSDCKLIITCKDQEKPIEIFVMRSLLGAKSEYFKALLQSGFKEGQENVVKCDWTEFGIKPFIAKGVINFFYRGKIALNEVADAEACFEVAQAFLIPGLRQVCDQWISEFHDWNQENAEHIFEIGKRYNSHAWQQAALSYAANCLFEKKAEETIPLFLVENSSKVENLTLNCVNLRDPPQTTINLIKTFPNLQQLNLSSFTCLGGPKFSKNLNFLSECKQLKNVSLSDEKIEDKNALIQILTILENCPIETLKISLRLVKLNLNQMMEKLLYFPDLKHLDIKSIDHVRSSKIYPYIPIPKELTKLKSLSLPRELLKNEKELLLSHSIDLKIDQCDEEFLKVLVNSNLEGLTIEKSTFDSFCLKYLSQMRNLKRLKIDLKTVRLDTAEYLASIPNLETLEIKKNCVPVEWLENFIYHLEKNNKLEQLQALSLELNAGKMDQFPYVSLSKLINLKKLNLVFYSTGNKTFEFNKLSSMKNLEEFKLRGVRHFLITKLSADGSFKDIQDQFPYLQKLFFSDAFTFLPTDGTAAAKPPSINEPKIVNGIIVGYRSVPLIKEKPVWTYSFEKGLWKITASMQSDLSFAKKIRSLNLILGLSTPAEQDKLISTIENPESIEELKVENLNSSNDINFLNLVASKIPNLKNLELHGVIASKQVSDTIGKMTALKTLKFNNMDFSHHLKKQN